MANPRDVIDELIKLHSKRSKDIAREPTGVKPGYHAGHGFTTMEDGRISYVGPAPAVSTLARASLTGTITLTNGTVTRIAYDAVDYDSTVSGNLFAYDAVNDWIYLSGWPDYPVAPTAWLEIGARVNIQTPDSGEEWDAGDALTLGLYRYDSVGPASVLITVLDYHVVTAATATFNYPVILHGTDVVPPIPANTQHYYIAVRNESRYDRVIVGSDGSSEFWALSH